jgi:hypothetical protein
MQFICAVLIQLVGIRIEPDPMYEIEPRGGIAQLGRLRQAGALPRAAQHLVDRHNRAPDEFVSR